MADYILYDVIRDFDVSEISGKGRIAVAIEVVDKFASRGVALVWLTYINSVAIYKSLEDMVKIHGHNGATRMEEYERGKLYKGSSVFVTPEPNHNYLVYNGEGFGVPTKNNGAWIKQLKSMELSKKLDWIEIQLKQR